MTGASLLLPAILLAFAIAACSPGTDGAGAEPARVPLGAIETGDDLYMVPLGADDSGCATYRAFSTTKMVPQAIYYRASDGRFVMDREDADCT